MKKSFIFLSLLLFGCGDKSTYLSTLESPSGKDDTSSQQRSDMGNEDGDSYSDSVLKSPKFYQFNALAFFNKKESFSAKDKRYLKVEESKDKEVVSWNGNELTSGVRDITISAKELVLKKGNHQGVFEQLHKVSDLRSLTILAEKVELDSVLELPSVNVKIYANVMIVGKDGSIVTTPLDRETNARQFKNGVNGLNAGEINLHVNDLLISNQRNVKAFVLSGGNGQGAGTGQKGRNGSRMNDFGGGVVYKVDVKKKCIHVREVRDRFNKEIECGPRWSYTGVQAWPTNGESAISGGKPGEPGNGGVFSSIQEVSSEHIDLDAGKAGRWAGFFLGGNPGIPMNSYHVVNDYRGRNNRKSQTSNKGGDVSSPRALKKEGKAGIVKIIESKNSWMNDGLAEFNLMYANDLYLNNRIEEARVVYDNIENYFTKVSNTEFEKSLKQTAVISSTHVQRNKIEGQLDFFGHKITWVPKLSFEANYTAFENDIESSMKILYLTYWILNSQNSLEEKNKALAELQDSLFFKMEKSKEDFNKLLDKIPLLKEKIDEYRVHEEFFQQKLVKLEAEIERMARNNVLDRHKTPMYKKALKVVAVIASVFPAGQPALAVVASTMMVALEAADSDNPVRSILSNAPKLYSSYESFDLEASRNDWNENWSKVKVSHFNSLKTDEERKEYLRGIVNFTKPIVNEMKKHSDIWRKQQVPSGEVEAEIAKIKALDPIFKQITKDLEELMFKKKVLNDEIQAIDTQLGAYLALIQNGFVTLGEISDQRVRISKGMDVKLNPIMQKIEEEAKGRLLKYHYRMARAFEYRLLIPYKENLNMDAITSKMIEVVEADQEGQLSEGQFNVLKGLYLKTLAQIVDRALEKFETNGVPRQREKVIYLSIEELNSLNKGNDIFLDLVNEAIFSEDYEDVRINNIIVEKMSISEAIPSLRLAEASLDITYSGKSYLRKNGEIYLFETQENSESKNHKWGANLDLIGDELSQINQSPIAESLMRMLIGENNDENLMLFSRPGGLTQLKLSLKKQSIPKIDFNVDKIAIKIIFDYHD
ncbi:hypothetical protein A9Q84_04395 [Halobacteriovorax marinus]|uniref:Lipoprotein n=1 Tax=Halobacteriovorax marinus TaxID=97084 RepID=A0A1Y5FG71_9BACT|nr:hypothetical protein A9Q84_04395 [Halobacteriovorax marinus]